MCRSTVRVHGIQTGPVSIDDTFLGILAEEENKDNSWAITFSYGKPVTLHIDTGAEVTVITEQTWAIGQPEMSHPERTLRGPGSHAILTLGKFTGTQGT